MREDSISRRKLLKAMGAASAIVLGSSVLGCIGGKSETTVKPLQTGNVTYTIAGNVRTSFAEYTPLPVSVKPTLVDYTLPADISDILGMGNAGVGAAGKVALAKNLFYMSPSKDDQIYDIYKRCKDSVVPIFVTSDSVLHSYHVLFDYALRRIEADQLIPAITELTQIMLDEAGIQQNAGIPEIKDQCIRNIAFFAVAKSLLGDDIGAIPSEARQLAQAELALIEAHEGFMESPIFGNQEDYSQYVPRGHYTRSEALKKYFRAMMWYGRMSFPLYKSTPGGKQPDVEHTRQAILIALGVKGHTLELWKLVYDPTVFFVGETDDLSIYDYQQLMSVVFGSTVALSDLKDDEKLQAFIDRAKSLKSPKIESTFVMEGSDADITKGFRFMGQRFIPDSYIFEGLVHDRVIDRYFPLGLDVMAVLGSQRAYEILDSLGETKYQNYQKQFDLLKAEFAALKADTWAQNLYWGWLYCLLALLNEKGEGYPTFMKSQAWADKELNTSLGSWTELRHDTILYAKQSYARATGMPLERDVPGYVEPNPELYSRLASLAKMTSDGLRARGLLNDEFERKLDDLSSLLSDLKGIAEKELTGVALSDDDYRLIKNIGEHLESLTTFSPETQGDISSDADKKMALIADVHTDPNSGRVLEEAVGNPCNLFVIVPVDGRLTLLQGAAFSYYEFKQPMSDRLTDEAWQEKIANGAAPALPEWTKSFMA